ncbi:MAG: Cna B-type domain-containing protein [Clostridia bacterium]|nr:Cna B-type domain-containing protein [Clostridia bacterium]
MTAGATVQMSYQGDVPVTDVEIRLYHVGDIVDETIVWSEEYAGYNLSADDVSGLTLASTLRSYVLRDGKTAQFSGITDGAGRVSFENVSAGCYLMDGDEKVLDDGIYRVVPSLVYVRNDEAVSLEIKHEFESVAKEEEKVSKTVKKVWEKNETTPIIRADLLKNGELFDSQVLDDVREWTYTWEDLDADALWTIVEHEVPEGYSLTVYTDGDTTTLVNRGTYEPPEPTEEPTPSPEPPVQSDEEPPPSNDSLANPNKTVQSPETGVENDALVMFGLIGLFVVLSIGSGIAVAKYKSK